LRPTHESNDLNHAGLANTSVVELDGIEVNNHVAIFGGELHLIRSDSFDSLSIAQNGDLGGFSGHFVQLSTPGVCIMMLTRA